MISRYKAPLAKKGRRRRVKMMVAEAKGRCNVIHGRPHLITVSSQAFCKVLDRQQALEVGICSLQSVSASVSTAGWLAPAHVIDRFRLSLMGVPEPDGSSSEHSEGLGRGRLTSLDVQVFPSPLWGRPQTIATSNKALGNSEKPFVAVQRHQRTPCTLPEAESQATGA